MEESEPETKLNFNHALGFKRGKGKCIEHVEDDKIAYIVGQHIAIFNYENKTHKFILKNPKTAEIYAFAVSSNRRYVALSEHMTDDTVQVSVYNFKSASRVRNLTFSGITSSHVVSLDFSMDNKYLATLTGGPNWGIQLWQLDKSKLISSATFTSTADRVSVSPWAHWQMVTCGPDDFHIWRYTENQLKFINPLANSELTKHKHYNFTCHAWFGDEKIVVGTAQGDIIVIDGQEVRQVLTAVHPNSASIDAIASVGRGFICGGAQGYFSLFEQSYDANYFHLYKLFQTQEQIRILDLSISPTSEESVVCCYENNQMAHFSLSNVDILKEDENNFPLLPIGFHTGMIIGMDVCVQKSVLVTAGADRTVRVWNYLKRTLEIIKTFDEDIFSIALHPTGFRILIGFRYKLCMFDLLSNDFHLCCEWQVRSCKMVRFSNGGHLFAALSATNILLFSSNTFEILNPLRGHSGLVQSISWSANDRVLVSAGFEGAVYKWDLDEYKKVEENIVKSCTYRSVAYDESISATVAIGNDSKIRFIVKGNIENEVATPYQLTQLCISQHTKTLFVGTQEGVLLQYRWPLINGSDLKIQEYSVHTSAITGLSLSEDEKFLFAADDTGSLYMFDVECTLDGRTHLKKSFNYEVFDDIAFIAKSELDEKTQTIKDLAGNLSKLEAESAVKIQEIAEEHEFQIKKLRHENDVIVASLKKEIEYLIKEKEQNEQLAARKLHVLEDSHMKQAEDIEMLYERKLREEQAKLEKLKLEKNEIIASLSDNIRDMEKKHAEEIKKLKREFEEETQKQIQSLVALKAETQYMRDKYEMKILQTEEEYEKELSTVKKKSEADLEQEKQALLAEKAQTTIHNQRIELLKMNISNLQSALKAKEMELDTFKKKREEDSKQINSLRTEIRIRDETITGNEKKIAELKKQTAELEKLRYVLTFKFNELRKEVAPKTEQIKVMTEKIQDMDCELEKVGIDRDSLLQLVNGKEEKVGVLSREVAKTKRLVDEKNRLIQSLLRELTDVVLENRDGRGTQIAVRDIVNKYSSKIKVALEDGEDDEDKHRIEEFERQREYLESKLSMVKKSTNRKEGYMKADNNRKTAENAMLVQEINQLRVERKNQQTKIQGLEAQIRELTAMVSAASSGGGSSAPGMVSGNVSRASLSRTSYGFGRIKTPDSFFSTPSGRNSTLSNKGGRIIKGSTKNVKDLSTLSAPAVSSMDREQVAGILQQVERNNREMEKQEEEIRRLRSYVQQLLNAQKSGTTVPAPGNIAGTSTTTDRPGTGSITPGGPSSNISSFGIGGASDDEGDNVLLSGGHNSAANSRPSSSLNNASTNAHSSRSHTSQGSHLHGDLSPNKLRRAESWGSLPSLTNNNN